MLLVVKQLPELELQLLPDGACLLLLQLLQLLLPASFSPLSAFVWPLPSASSSLLLRLLFLQLPPPLPHQHQLQLQLLQPPQLLSSFALPCVSSQLPSSFSPPQLLRQQPLRLHPRQMGRRHHLLELLLFSFFLFFGADTVSPASTRATACSDF